MALPYLDDTARDALNGRLVALLAELEATPRQPIDTQRAQALELLRCYDGVLLMAGWECHRVVYFGWFIDTETHAPDKQLLTVFEALKAFAIDRVLGSSQVILALRGSAELRGPDPAERPETPAAPPNGSLFPGAPQQQALHSLLLDQQRVRRDELARAIYPDETLEAALARLYQLLKRYRKALRKVRPDFRLLVEQGRRGKPGWIALRRYDLRRP